MRWTGGCGCIRIPTAQALREKLAKLHGCQPENIIVGNGSDELLALATRAFVEPVAADVNRRKHRAFTSAATVQFFTPSYSLYPVLADIHGAAKNPVPLKPDFSLPSVAELKRGRHLEFQRGADFCDDAERAERARLQNVGTGKTLPRRRRALWFWTRLTWISRRKTR